MNNLLWKIILGYIFLRPFVSEIDFTVLAFVLNLIFLLLGCIYISKRSIKFASIDKIIALFLLTLLISITLSDSPFNSLVQLNKYIPLMVLFYIIRATDIRDRRQIIFTLIISSILVSIYSLSSTFVISRFVSEYLSNNTSYPYAEELLIRKRAYYPFITPNLLATYLVMIFMLCLGLTIQKIKENKKVPFFSLNFLCLSITVVTLFFTKSIGGWLTFLFSIFAFFVLGKILNKKTLLLILLIALALSAVWIMRMQGNEDFTKPLFSVQRRVSYWKETIDIIRMHPLKGIGIGNLYLKESRTAHNSYLQIWAEMGILGIASWLGIVFLFIKDGLKKLYVGGVNYYRLGILLSGISFLFHNLIDFSFFIPEAAFLWWVTLGLNQVDL